jgi:hypothetical protein
MLSVFRVLPSYPRLKLETITKPFTGFSDQLPELKLVLPWLEDLTRRNPGWRYFKQENTLFTVGRKLVRLMTAGPNHKLQLVGYPADALAFTENPVLLK